MAEDNDNIRVPFGDGLRPIDKGFFITPPDPYEGLSSEEKEMRKALDKIMSEKFQKKLSPEDVEKIKIQQEIRKRQAEEMGLPEGLQLMNQGGRTGFAKGKLAIPEPGNIKGTAAAKKGNAGLISFGIIFCEIFLTGLNAFDTASVTPLKLNRPIVPLYIIDVKASTQSL